MKICYNFLSFLKGGEFLGYAFKFNTEDYINKIHSDSKGWITRSVIDDNGYKQWHYKYAQLKDLEFTGENIYITLNTFYKPCRR